MIVLILRNFKVAVVVRTLVRMGCKRTEVRATLKSCQRQPNLSVFIVSVVYMQVCHLFKGEKP